MASKETQKPNKSLSFVWKIRLSFYAEGDKLWAEGILAHYGDVTIQWKSSTHCIVDETEEFTEKTT